MKNSMLAISFATLLLFVASLAVAGDQLRPYVLAQNAAGSMNAKVAEVKQALTGHGFQIAGEYSPYPGAHVIVVTNDVLKSGAAQSDRGGYGAVERVAVTEADGKLQVSFTNPYWTAGIYRLSTDMSGVAQGLSAALGQGQEFGAEGNGWTDADLRKYNYMMFMPYFTDQTTLAEYGSYADAVAAVEAGLAAGKGGTAKVYRVDIPGKDETVFGVSIKEGDGSDKTVMATTDTGPLKHTAHLPYEMLVSGNKVYMLHGKFRIAQSFPMLTMGTFMKIVNAPGAIQDALEAAARNE
jgi:hypothetical protein